ncbi:hypothetical protein AX769_03495 [Frondihabitans sp. PAMC 28766]|uniref:hypothetical protein n=1 Tax=Frondihabitans sp. PAMC 28766 TaxID=1795630 RepID=UPI00078C4309|nr:hypothetical protein [Frondihabitans sp. PAMC 28766]AMM19367.1 hypothetical protein AX769_03495 [Frondihabitans sp. PAMC 28766]
MTTVSMYVSNRDVPRARIGVYPKRRSMSDTRLVWKTPGVAHSPAFHPEVRYADFFAGAATALQNSPMVRAS